MKPKKCALISTPRAGTHYLRMSLDNHPKVRWGGELFRPEVKWPKEEEEIRSYIYDDVSFENINSFNYIGFVWHLCLESDLSTSDVDKFILLKRRNSLLQMASLLIASETGNWRDTKATEKIKLNITQLEWFIERQENYYKNFESWQVEHKVVFYEDLCNSFEETIRSIQEYLELDYCRLEPAKLIKQETRPLQKIISNYEEVKWTLEDMNLL